MWAWKPPSALALATGSTSALPRSTPLGGRTRALREPRHGGSWVEVVAGRCEPPARPGAPPNDRTARQPARHRDPTVGPPAPRRQRLPQRARPCARRPTRVQPLVPPQPPPDARPHGLRHALEQQACEPPRSADHHERRPELPRLHREVANPAVAAPRTAAMPAPHSRRPTPPESDDRSPTASTHPAPVPLRATVCGATDRAASESAHEPG